MTLAAIATLLQTTLILLNTVAAHPELPQSARDSATQVAQQAIVAANQAITKSSPGLTMTEVKNPIDVFVLAGSDNAVGFGDASKSRQVETGTVLQYANGKLSDANDPVGNASTGSSWPTFGATYHQLTGSKVALIPTAVTGSSIVAQANGTAGTWESGSKLISDMRLASINAGQALTVAGYTPILRGIIWAEGEAEGAAANAGTISTSQHTLALQKAITDIRNALETPTLPFYILQTGNQIGADDKGYGLVRAAENTVENSSSKVYIVSRAAVTFPALNMQTEGVRYTQSGYTNVGVSAADNIVRVQNGQVPQTARKEGLYSITPAGPRTLTFMGFVNGTNSCDTSAYTFSYGDGQMTEINVPENTCGPYVFTTTHTYAQAGTYDQRLDTTGLAAHQTGADYSVIQSNTYTVSD